MLGLAAGLVIAIMCATGTLLAFEKEIIAWAERDVRKVIPQPKRFPIEELLAKTTNRPNSLTIYGDPKIAFIMNASRTNAIYINQYTGEFHNASAPGLRAFMQSLLEWHRFISLSGDSRPTGKAITGASNVIFLILAISGVYLWLAAVVWKLNLKLKGKARDWNWHNAIGIWSVPALIVITATALPISYKLIGDAIYKNTPPQQSEAKKPADAKALSIEALFDVAWKAYPTAEQITFRRPANFTVKERNAWPRTATVQLTLDPASGEIQKREGFSDFPTGRKVRTWTRFLHTGEALGAPGQLIAGIASFAGLILVYTGFALAYRRFRG